MNIITIQDIPEILASHAKWLKGEEGGKRADLTGADLNGADLFWADLTGADLTGANLSRADLFGADLTGVNLAGTNLTGANLTGADLTGANLTGAKLTGANLTGANLYGANLYGAKGISPTKVQPLLILLDQPGEIRAYKMVTAEGKSPMQGNRHYEIGKTVSAENANTDINETCAAGINVATLDWCIRKWQFGWRILVVEFTASDIAAIPTASEGEFRLHRCKVVAEKDLAELGLEAAIEARGGENAG
jgi:hypothetical protein